MLYLTYISMLFSRKKSLQRPARIFRYTIWIIHIKTNGHSKMTVVNLEDRLVCKARRSLRCNCIMKSFRCAFFYRALINTWANRWSTASDRVVYLVQVSFNIDCKCGCAWTGNSYTRHAFVRFIHIDSFLKNATWLEISNT